MGMLLTYRKGYWPDGDKPARRGGKARKSRSSRPEPQAPAAEPVAVPEGLDALTDDEVLEAYSISITGDADRTEPFADTREAMVAELQALDAEPAAAPAAD